MISQIIFLSSPFLADDLMKNKSSFIYGENPAAVPVYAVVSMCSAAGDGGEVIKNGEK